jgi:nucleotide-binding universal stress UspA family protein
MVLIRNRPDDDLVLNIALELAKVHKANVNLLQFFSFEETQANVSESKLAMIKKVKARGLNSRVHAIVCEKGEKIKEKVVKVSAEYDLITFSAGRHTFWDKFVRGTSDDYLMTKASCSILSIQGKKP